MTFIMSHRNQNWLLPPNVLDLIDEDHICRFVDEVIECIPTLTVD